MGFMDLVKQGSRKTPQIFPFKGRQSLFCMDSTQVAAMLRYGIRHITSF